MAMGLAWILALALAVTTCLATAGHSWRLRRATPAALALALALTGSATWAACDLVAAVNVTDSSLAIKLSFAGVDVAVIGMYWLCQSVANPHYRFGRKQAIILSALPAVLFATALVAPVPGPFFSTIRPEGFGNHPHVAFAWLFYVHAAYCYMLLSRGCHKVLAARRSAAPIFRAQFDNILVAALLPIVGNVITVGFPALVGYRDITTLLFTCTALIDARALLRHGLLRIIPVARDQVLECIDDSVVVLDAHNRIIDVNPSARRLARRLRPELPADLVGLDAAMLAPMLDAPNSEASTRRTLEVLPGHHIDLRSTVLSDSRGRLLGRVVVGHDISDLVNAQGAVEQQLEIVEALRHELVEQTLRDPLTGVHNRRHLTDSLHAALAEADRCGKPVALLVVDIDHFKAINDEWGHQAGDRALIAIARSLSDNVRPGDTVVRFGGEEFVVVLPGAARDDARRRAEHLRAACSAAVDLAHRVTVSIGIAVYADDAVDADALIAAADHALYAAKATGRDRVVDATRADLDLAAVAAVGR